VLTYLYSRFPILFGNDYVIICLYMLTKKIPGHNSQPICKRRSRQGKELISILASRDFH
jgi:hypothetical protein